MSLFLCLKEDNIKLHKTTDGKLIFYCEGCDRCHGVSGNWDFNGDFYNPTISPSILVKGTQPITDEEYDLIMSGVHVEPKPFVCHSFVADGKIQYLDDCTHELAGQTVELLHEDEWFE